MSRMSGMRSVSRLRRRRPPGAFQKYMATATKPTAATMYRYQKVLVKSAAPMSRRVDSGNFAPRPLKKTANFGNTQTARTATVTNAMPSTTIGYASAWLIRLRVSRSRSR